MPTYDLTCKVCGKVREAFIKLSHFDSPSSYPQCCGEKMAIVILAPVSIKADNVCYRSTIDGTMITGTAQHRKHLKEHGCTEVGNETPKQPGPTWQEKKRDHDSLRQEISDRLN